MSAPRTERTSTQETRVVLGPRALRPVARVISAVLEPAFYWLDLTSPDPLTKEQTPSNSKLVYTAAAVVALVTVFHQGISIGRHLMEKGGDFPMGFTVFALGVLLFCGSFDAFKRWIQRFGGGGGGGSSTVTRDREHSVTETRGPAAPPPPPAAGS